MKTGIKHTKEENTQGGGKFFDSNLGWDTTLYFPHLLAPASVTLSHGNVDAGRMQPKPLIGRFFPR
jgi:hypothetical protein